MSRLLLLSVVFFSGLSARAANSFPNVLNVGPFNSSPAYFYINTKIPFETNVAPQIRVTGYMYGNANKALDIRLGWYMWNNAFYWTQYHSELSFAKPSRIRLGTYVDGSTTRVRIEIANDGVYWASYFVSATDILGYDPNYTGWSYYEGTMPADTGLVTEVPLQGDVQIFGNLTAANFANGTITGSASGLYLNAGGTNQNITLMPSGVGKVGIGKVPDTFKLDVAGAGNGNFGVRLTPDYGLVRFNGIDLLGYPSQTLWEISNSSVAEFVLGTSWNWDNQVALSYTPGAIGSAGGIFSIGQTNKNNANYTHGATRFYTNGLERMRIDNAGKVGIGTSSPMAALDVIKPGNTNVYENGIRANRPDSQGQYAFMGYGQLSADAYFGSVYTGGPGTYGSIHLRQYTQGMIARDALNIDSNGFVGIGTTSPGVPLEIKKPNGGGRWQFVDEGADVYSAINIRNSANNAFLPHTFRSAGFTVNDGTADRLTVAVGGNIGIGTPSPNEPLEIAGTGRMFLGDGGGATRKGLLLDAVEDGTYVRLHAYNYGTSASLNLVINPYGGGNVGIGTITPTHKLSVNGTIRAKEIIVDTGWADYVFDANYRLAPLSEVESHIKAEKHLPGIPSAQEIAEHGVSMGDMQSKLLSKIEELTLHMIQMEKENTELRQRVQKLEATTATP